MNPQNRDRPVSPGKGLSRIATGDLTDEEVTMISQVVGSLVLKYSSLPATDSNLARLDDEASDRLYRLGYLVHLDIEPVLEGKPPVIDIIGKIGDMGFQAEHDHERSRYHILKAKEKSEDYHGQREPINTIKAKKRSQSSKPNESK